MLASLLIMAGAFAAGEHNAERKAERIYLEEKGKLPRNAKELRKEERQLKKDAERKSASRHNGGRYTEIPSGEEEPIAVKKSEAYRNGRRSRNEEYFLSLEETLDDGEDISLVSSSLKEEEGKEQEDAPMYESATEKVFGPPPSPSPQPNVQRSPSTASYAQKPMSTQEKLQYDRQRAEMIRDVLSGNEAEDKNADEAKDETPVPLDLNEGVSDGIISSLDGSTEDQAIRYSADIMRPVRCMFVRNEKVKSGQRIILRMLEEYHSDGVRIPANTHVAAICRIGSRLEMQVRSVELNGRIYQLNLDAYDTDGLPGIYCPETATAKGAKDASRDAMSAATSTFGGLIGDIANTMLRTGASIARNAKGEVTVSISSGYEFYLAKPKK